MILDQTRCDVLTHFFFADEYSLRGSLQDISGEICPETCWYGSCLREKGFRKSHCAEAVETRIRYLVDYVLEPGREEVTTHEFDKLRLFGMLEPVV